MTLTTLILAASLAAAAPEATSSATSPARKGADRVTLTRCLVSLVDEAQVPAKEPGALTQLDVHEGDQVTRGQLLARIDDVRTAAALKVATLKLKAAKEEAASDVNVRYARAANDVAKQERAAAEEANRKSANTFAESEVRKMQLEERRTELAIEQSALELRLAGTKAEVGEAEVEAAAEDVERRKIVSPLEGVVVRVNRHVGEWLQPGDPLLHVVRIDKLRVEGLVDATDVTDGQGRVVAEGFAPAEIAGRPVTVRVPLERGRGETFQGKVVFVSPVVQAGGQYRVWAEVPNRKQGEHWLLRPGLLAEMTIHLAGH